MSNSIGMPGDFLSQLRDGALSLLFPPRCEICDTLQEPVICAPCRAQFTAIGDPICRCCGSPLDPRAHAPDLCRECREEPMPFDAARAGGVYGGTLRRAVHLFKYDGVRALAGPLAGYLADQITLPFELDALCPVPLHPTRAQLRGYNQSLLLAEELGARWGLPVLAEAMTRTRNTPPQMQLPAEERRRNVKGAFAVAETVIGRCLGLVDDVFTTGSTLRKCSRVLKQAGAARVLVLTMARAVPERDLPLASSEPSAEVNAP